MLTYFIKNYYRTPLNIIMLIFGIGCFAVAGITYKDMDGRTIAFLILLGALYTVFNPIILWRNSRRQYRKNPVYQNEITYEFDDNGVTVSQGDVVTSKEWPMFWKAVDFGSIVVLYLAVNNGIIIPKEDIGDNYDAFCDMVSSHMKSNIKKKK